MRRFYVHVCASVCVCTYVCKFSIDNIVKAFITTQIYIFSNAKPNGGHVYKSCIITSVQR